MTRILLFLAVLLPIVAHADDVYLLNGRAYMGVRVVDSTAAVVRVVFRSDTIDLRRDMILRIDVAPVTDPRAATHVVHSASMAAEYDARRTAELERRRAAEQHAEDSARAVRAEADRSFFRQHPTLLTPLLHAGVGMPIGMLYEIGFRWGHLEVGMNATHAGSWSNHPSQAKWGFAIAGHVFPHEVEIDPYIVLRAGTAIEIRFLGDYEPQDSYSLFAAGIRSPLLPWLHGRLELGIATTDRIIPASAAGAGDTSTETRTSTHLHLGIDIDFAALWR